MSETRITVWNEFRHEKSDKKIAEIYPSGIHAAIRDLLLKFGYTNVTLASLDEPECGLSDSLLENTDVLIWWGHMAHKEVPDELADKIRSRVYLGKMGFIALHSAHQSKPFCAIVGTNGNLSWGREQREIIWNLFPSHPITAGIPDHFILDREELYCEPFYIPQPDELLFGSWYEDGYIFRSGACFYRGAGKVFYFQPGHESCRSFYNPYVGRIIANAVAWAAPSEIGYEVSDQCPQIKTKVTDEFGN